jgi:cation:H+ antiporter
MGLDGTIGRLDGVLLFAGILAYLRLLFVQSRKEKALQQDPDAPPAPLGTSALLRDLLYIAAGLGMLVLGSRWLVDSAVSMAQLLGVSDMVIGLTIIAAGTSLPEVVTSIMASIKGERDIAVGNVVGSNIFNIFAVLGLASIVAPQGIGVSTEALRFDIPFMIAVALACLPIFFTGGLIKRWEGGLLLAYYVAYTAYLVLAAGKSDSVTLLRDGMLYFAAPLTAVTLLVLAAQHHLLERRKQV